MYSRLKIEVIFGVYSYRQTPVRVVLLKKHEKQTNISSGASQTPLLILSTPFYKIHAPVSLLYHQTIGIKNQ
jgi:hypothetical protein